MKNKHIVINHETPVDHLIVPDEHYFPGDNFRRCKALGNYIVEHRPEVIARLGDMWDMTSLCTYEKGKKDLVFKNVKDDLEAGHEAEEIIFAPLLRLNKELAKAKKKQYNPLIIKLLGNHENRINKLLSYEPKWEGMVSMKDFESRLPIDELIVDYNSFIQVDGVYYSHCWASGVLGKPFSSAKAMIAKRGVSCTNGHSHILDFAISKKPNGEMIRGLIAGCFQDPDTIGFAGPQVGNIYWNGLIHKKAVFNGDYDHTEIKIDRLLADML